MQNTAYWNWKNQEYSKELRSATADAALQPKSYTEINLLLLHHKHA